jgi:hypothetical protein
VSEAQVDHLEFEHGLEGAGLEAGRDLAGTAASNDPSADPDKYGSLVQRFDQRAARLRRQASLFLWIIIGVLVVGTAAFIFANYIANLNLHPLTAEAQYTAAAAALKQTKEQEGSIAKQINQIYDTSSLLKPYDEKLHIVEDEYRTFEDNILKKCNSITLRQVNVRPGPPGMEPGENPSPALNLSTPEISSVKPAYRIGEFQISTPYESINFANSNDADSCRSLFLPEHDQILTYLRRAQDIRQDMNATLLHGSAGLGA